MNKDNSFVSVFECRVYGHGRMGQHGTMRTGIPVNPLDQLIASSCTQVTNGANFLAASADLMFARYKICIRIQQWQQI